MNVFRSVSLIVIAFAVPAFATVTVTSPTPGATVTSPVQYIATAAAPACAAGVGSMGIYVNNVQVYSSHGASQINTQLTLNPGSNHTVVQEWDKCGGSSYTTVNLTVASGPTATLAAAPTTVVAGNPATLSWSTTNATAVSIAPGIGSVQASGSTTVTPSATTEYTLTATGNAGTATSVATVTVQTTTPTATLSASPTSITGGNTSTLSWSTTNATTVSINQGIGIVSASGSTVVSPTSTTQYVLTATSNSGATATASSTVTVQTQGATNSPITNLIIVMMQNHSLDNLFGTYPGANGLNASLPSYSQVDAKGNTISPTLVNRLSVADLNHNRPTYVASWDNGLMDKFAYTNGDLAMQYYDNTISGLASDQSSWSIANLWSYAQQYALADNFFASAMNSEPAQEFYMVAATAFNLTTASSLPYYDPCSAVEQAKDGDLGTIAGPLTTTTLGDQLTAAQVSWGYYMTNYANSQSGTCTNYTPQEDPFQYFTSTENSSHIQNFTLASFESDLNNGTVPSVLWIQPDGDQDMHPGGGNVMDGVEFLSTVVQDVQNSSIWPNSAIIVLWDESGGWYDHVAPPQLANTEGLGARVPVLVISPFAKTNYISHQQMDFVSILRFIQWNWNLGELPAASQSAREQQSGDLCDLLTTPCGAPAPPQ
ncbi:MAG: alkaline phosphatase family protein [Acidobacteriaceae bacterium]